ncbi:MAG: hypothetical protein RIS79_2130 [Verrucomicrobiota bacterium]|jgi:hypothetical protein
MKTYEHHLHPIRSLTDLLRRLGLARHVRLLGRIPLPCATRPRRRLSARF